MDVGHISVRVKFKHKVSVYSYQIKHVMSVTVFHMTSKVTTTQEEHLIIANNAVSLSMATGIYSEW